MTALLTGLIITGEALTLLVRMRWCGDKNNPWISRKNDLLAGIDIPAGAALIGLAWREKTTSRAFRALAAGVLVTHGYRELEYVAHADHKFLATRPLFVVNNVKIAGLLLSLSAPPVRKKENGE